MCVNFGVEVFYSGGRGQASMCGVFLKKRFVLPTRFISLSWYN
jgi:hypothetical protein